MRIENNASVNLPNNQPCEPGSGADDFGQMLKDALSEVNEAQQNSSEMVNAFAQGKNVELHRVMMAMERASVAMQLTLQVRNKVLEAYQEVSRMQV